MSREKALKRLLEKNSHGKCSDSEKKMLEEWFEIIGEKKTGHELSEEDKYRMLNEFSHSPRFTEKTIINNYRAWKMIAAAACIVAILLASLYTINSGSRSENKTVAIVRIETGTGEIKQVYLPDSSSIWMNAKTRIEYGDNFAINRRIKLIGEAYFDVKSDKDHPFTVLTSDSLQTTVLGTTFNISSYEKSAESNITVLTGKVQVEQKNKAGKIGILSPNESIVYHHRIQTYEKKNIDAHAMIGWTTGDWELKSNGIRDLSLIMENHFGIKLIINKPGIDSTVIDMNFSNKQKPEEIIKVFSLLTGCSHKWIDQQTVELN